MAQLFAVDRDFAFLRGRRDAVERAVGALALTLQPSGLTLAKIGGEAGIVGGFIALTRAAPGHFHMILTPDNPFYKDLPGNSVLIGGMWIMNVSYWGFNQYIIQRALAAKDIREAQ